MRIVWGFTTDHESIHMVNLDDKLYVRVYTGRSKQWFTLSAQREGPFQSIGVWDHLEKPFQKKSQTMTEV